MELQALWQLAPVLTDLEAQASPIALSEPSRPHPSASLSHGSGMSALPWQGTPASHIESSDMDQLSPRTQSVLEIQPVSILLYWPSSFTSSYWPVETPSYIGFPTRSCSDTKSNLCNKSLLSVTYWCSVLSSDLE